MESDEVLMREQNIKSIQKDEEIGHTYPRLI